MKHKVTRDLYEYWQRIRRGRPAPERSEIEPGDIRTLLGDTFILEVVARTEFRYRLAGTRVCAVFGREMKGKDFLASWSGKDHEAVTTLLGAICDDSAAAVLGITGVNDRNKELPLECLLLPVSQPGQGNSRVLGCLAQLDDPYWIGVHPIMRQTITSMRMIWPDERPHQIMRGALPDLSPDRSPAASSNVVPLRRRVGHLTVYEGGKKCDVTEGIESSTTRL